MSLVGLVILGWSLFASTSLAVQAAAIPTDPAFAAASDSAYSWLKASQDKTGNGLVDSFNDYWADGTPIQIAYTYDQAVAAIAFLVKGDVVRAKQVLSIMQKLQSPDGSWVNSYWWNNLYGEELRKHLGPAMWMAMAVRNYEQMTGDTTTYHTMATNAIDWALTFQNTTNGAISGGMTTWDSPPNWTPEVWSSTEHNIDAYPTLLYFASTTPAKTSTYNAAAVKVKSFLDNVVWDKTRNVFFGGFKNNTQLIDTSIPLDVNPWSVLGVGTGYSNSINFVESAHGDANGIGTLANPRYAETLTDASTGKQISAYDFDWESDNAQGYDQNHNPIGLKGPDIWFEGSSFMSEAYYLLGNKTKADDILTNIIKKQDANGGIAYSLYGTNNNYWQMKQEECVSSTGWLILAAARWNPFTASSLGGTTPPTTTPTVTNTTTTPTVTTTTTPTVTTTTPIAPYTQGVTALNSSQAQIWFKPTTTASSVIVHYTVAGGAQQNVNMTNNAGTWQQAISSLVNGNVINYSFTYMDSVGHDTGNYTYTFTGGTSTTTTPTVTTTTSTPTVTTTTPVGPYTQGVTALNSSQAQIWFKPTTTASSVIVHYTVANGAQQNLNMTNNNGTWQFTVSGLVSGNTITYSFTYMDSVGHDTGSYSYTFTGSGTTTTTPTVTTTTPTVTTTTTPVGPYTQGVRVLNGSQAQIWFTPTTTASSVIVHYTVTGSGQQNVNMTNNNGTWQFTVSGLVSGNVITYSFTYMDSVGHDTGNYTYTYLPPA
jgi:hypothetical protein